MRIVSWNVNSIRTRHDRVRRWLERHGPDIVLLQETKCTDHQFEAFAASLGCSDPDSGTTGGYDVAHWGVDQWNGVAILSRVGLCEIERGFPGFQRPPFDEARLLSATAGGLRVHSVYVPNGRRLDDPHYLFKLVWLERLRGTVDVSRPSLVAGDFNVAPADADIYDPKRWRGKTHASPPERAAVDSLLDMGLIDVTRRHLPDQGTFTWWSYRPGQFERNRGLRIDLALCTMDVADRVTTVWVDTTERAGERPSDHAPLVVELDAEVRPARG